MGTIASVLQWTCKNCNLINPTESIRCIRCGYVRKIVVVNRNLLLGEQNECELENHDSTKCKTCRTEKKGFIDIGVYG